jgi:hypothetical protein
VLCEVTDLTLPPTGTLPSSGIAAPVNELQQCGLAGTVDAHHAPAFLATDQKVKSR